LNEGAQRELVEAFAYARSFWLTLKFPDPFSLDLMTSFILEARFEFIGQTSPGQKPVQCLAALFGAANPDPGRSMPQLNARSLEETLLNVFFFTLKGVQPFAQSSRLSL
jgi:hypothetical protein